MKIKNWTEFQHFKDRTPPWIKLYRYLLDDPEWHALSGDDAKRLIMIWLVASEDKKMEGNLPSIKNLAFRLRVTEKEMNQTLNRLSGWMIQDDTMMTSECYQVVIPETEERQRQSRDRVETDSFDLFWSLYPKKTGKDAARKAWKTKKPPIDEVIKALEWQVHSDKWTKNSGQFIENPATYINSGNWQDEQKVEELW